MIKATLFKKAFASVVALVLVVSFILPGSVHAKTVKKSTLHYVALGDSLAAGYVPGKGYQDGYPEYLDNRLEQSNYRTDLENLGVGGFKTKDVLSQLTNPSIIAEVSGADIITLDIGANDVLGAVLSGQDPTVALTNALSNIGIILATIHQLNPDAKVFVMGYYNLHPDFPGASFISPVLEAFNGQLETIAENSGATFVPTADIVAKSYQSFLTPFDIHLTESGYQAVAKEFWKALIKTKGWKQTK